LHGVKTLSVQATTLLLVVAGVLSLGLWTTGQANWLGLTVAAFLFALFSGYSGILDGMQNAARQRVIVAWHDGLAQWLRFLTAVGLVSLLGAFSQVAMLGYALASVVVLGSQYWFFHRRIFTLGSSHSPGTPNEVQDCVKQMRAYGWPFATWGLFTWAYMASDRWALQVFDTTSAVGLYAVLRQLGYYPIILLSGLIMQLVTPMFFGRAGDGSDPTRLQHGRKLNNMLVLGALLLTLLGTLLTFLLHSQIFLLLAAPEYREVSGFLPWMVLSGGLFAAGQLSVLSLLSGTNTQRLIMPKIVTALLGVGLNFLGAYWLSVKGVVFANLVFSLSYFVWVSLLGNLSFRADQLASSG